MSSPTTLPMKLPFALRPPSTSVLTVIFPLPRAGAGSARPPAVSIHAILFLLYTKAGLSPMGYPLPAWIRC